MAALDDYRGQFPELQGLEQEVTRLESLLMQRQGLTRSRASSLSITVENALRASASSMTTKRKTVMVLGTGPQAAWRLGLRTA